jgi:hypothetical protein
MADGSEFVVNTTSGGDQFASSLAVDGQGDFVVAWNGNGPGDTDGVFAQRYTVEGTDGNGGVGDALEAGNGSLGAWQQACDSCFTDWSWLSQLQKKGSAAAQPVA